MGRTVGIDLGTTNSEVAIVENGQARILPDADGNLMLPSCVGFSDTGKLLVGREALRQYAAAPERTVRSIKRWMGTDHKTTLRIGGSESEETKDYLPHEISAIILRSLKQRAESALGEEVTKAVITVPAYFTDAQRQATKTAGEIAGFEVLQIINEPTAAALAYDVRSEDTERVLVYDLGGGTFDVSVVEITGSVTEVLASHGNNRLGGDDFDRRLQLHLTDIFLKTHGVNFPDEPSTQARLLQAAEEIKMELSSHAFAPVREAFLGTKGNTALHLETEVARSDFEDLIRPLVNETLEAIDRALADADLAPSDLDRVILVGGSTRVPLVQQMVDAHLNQKPVDGIQPDLCVALGAALQAGVLVGEDVEAILVDVIPHSLGISAVVMTPMGMMPGFFSVIIPRNSVVPVSRSQVYSTTSDNQSVVKIDVFQGENQIAEENVPLGSYKIEDIPPGAAGSVKIEVHFDFDLNGILTVTTTEKGKGQQVKLVVESATGVQKLSSHDLNQAKDYLDSLFEEDIEDEDAIFTELDPELAKLVEQGQKLIDTIEDQQADELLDLLDRLEEAISNEETALIAQLQEELSDFLYYSTTKES
ncbi:MAG: Hsp70 family protein [Pseudanabaena sp.]